MFIKRKLKLLFIPIILCGCSANNDKPLQALFIKVVSDDDFITENDTLNIKIYYAHDFYKDDGYYSSPIGEGDFYSTGEYYYLNIFRGEEKVFSEKLEDFTDEKYDCCKNKKIEYPDIYKTFSFSYEELISLNSETIDYEINLCLEVRPRGNANYPLRFIKEDSGFRLKHGYFNL